MNQSLKNEAKKYLKELLLQCDEKQHQLFKRMYSHNNLELHVNDVVDNISDDDIDHAVTQCERTVQNNIRIKDEQAQQLFEDNRNNYYEQDGKNISTGNEDKRNADYDRSFYS